MTRFSHSFHLSTRQKAFFLILICSLILICYFGPRIVIPPLGSKANEQFEQYETRFFQEEVSQNTLNLHYTLKNPQNYQIENTPITFGDFSERGRDKEYKSIHDWEKGLLSIADRYLSTSNQLDYTVFVDYLQKTLDLEPYQIYEEPLTPDNGVCSQLPILLAEYPFYDETDVKNYLQLLTQIDTYFAQIMDFEREKAAAGLFMSDDQCIRVLECCENFLAQKEDNILLTSFDTRLSNLDNLSTDTYSSYINENRKAVFTHVYPAYATMESDLTQLLGSGKNDWGLYYYDKGIDYYELLVRQDTGSSRSVPELYDAIASARDEDLSICRQLLLQDDSLYEDCCNWEFTSTQDMSASNASKVHASCDSTDLSMLMQLQTAMQDTFPTCVNTNCNVNYVEKSLQDYLAPAFYITAPIDDYLNNSIYVNPAKSGDGIQYYTTLAHEGFPGHLYQTVMSFSYGLKPARALLDYPGYTEGWATYVEMLSYKYAGLSTEEANFLSHNQSATLSLYAQSDIGIHYLGWKEEELKDFWADYGIEDDETLKEIAGYILEEPGNYLKYYVGYLEFMDLKDDAMEKYKDDFDEKAFHKAILQIGPAPFSILREYLDDYYNKA